MDKTDKTFSKELFFEFAKEFAEKTKNVSLELGDGPPMFAMVFNAEMAVACLPLDNCPTKDVAQSAVKELTKKLNGLGVIFVSESWLLITKEEDLPEGNDIEEQADKIYEQYGSLENHPDKKECICINAMTRQETKAFNYFIERNDKGKISALKEADFFGETVESMGGRMASPFSELTH